MNSYEISWPSRVLCPNGPGKRELGRGCGHIRCFDAEQKIAVEPYKEMPSQLQQRGRGEEGGMGVGVTGKDL